MSAKLPFQFAVLRYIHDAFTGEFLNVGLALYCHDPVFFKVRLLQKYRRITNAFPQADGEFYRRYIAILQNKFNALADKVNSRQSTFEPWLPERMEELLVQVLPPDDSSIQFSEVQGGMTQDLEATFEDIYKRLIEAHLPREEHESRSEAEIWYVYREPLRKHNVIRFLTPHVIHIGKQDFEFDHAWKNGRWNALQPLSFDLVQPKSIRNKALQHFGTNVVLNESKDVNALYYLLGAPRRDDKAIQKEYDKAKDLLGTGEHARKIKLIEEDEAEDFAREIASKIETDATHGKKK